MLGLWTELQRRNVVRVAVAYGVVGWLLAQVAGTLEDALGLPEWFDATVVTFLLIGFPFAVIVSWVYELTPEGLKKTKAIDTENSIASETAKRLDLITLGALALVLMMMFAQPYINGGATVSPNAPAEPEMAPPGSVEQASIAVLPFVNMSSDPEQEYFSDGISEELLNQFAKIPDLQVTARTSSFQYKGKEADTRTIALELGVAHILEGSVRKSGNRLRITAQLIKADDGFHLWSESYDRELNDIFAIQDEISAAIVSALSAQLGYSIVAPDMEAGGTLNAEAQDAYLLGRHLFETRTEENLRQAQRYFERAVVLDPNFAKAWAELGLTQMSLNTFAFGSTGLEDAEAIGFRSIQRALAINPDVAEVQVAIGNYHSGNDEERAFNHYNRAIELNPNYARAYQWLGGRYVARGEYNIARQMIEKASQLDPLSIIILSNLSFHHTIRGEFEQARAVQARMAAIDPDSLITKKEAGDIAIASADYALAVVSYRNWLKESGSTLPQRAELVDALAALELNKEALELYSGTHLEWFGAFLAGSDEDYIALAREQISPESDRPFLRNYLALAELMAGDYEVARQLFERSNICTEHDDNVSACAALSYVYQQTGDAAKAAELAAKTRQNLLAAKNQGLVWRTQPVAYYEAILLMVEGDIDGAMDIYREQVREGYVPQSFQLSLFDPLKAHPDWPTLDAEIKAVQARGRARLAKLEAQQ